MIALRIGDHLNISVERQTQRDRDADGLDPSLRTEPAAQNDDHSD